MNFCHNNAIKSNTTHNHNTYANKFINHVIKLIGSIIANITAYVGLQLENTGQSDIHTIILHKTPFLLADFHRFWFDLSENHNLVERFFHTFGNKVIIQNNINITHENNFQTIGSTQIKTVDALSSRENKIIENHNEAIIMYGLYLSSESVAHAHRITGNNGRTHGARIVNTQAKNDTINNVIIYILFIK